MASPEAQAHQAKMVSTVLPVGPDFEAITEPLVAPEKMVSTALPVWPEHPVWLEHQVSLEPPVRTAHPEHPASFPVQLDLPVVLV